MADSPPAFPFAYEKEIDGVWRECAHPGMALRDWFAGQALAGMCANRALFDGAGTVRQCADQVAYLVDRANAVADAMLAAREEQAHDQ